MSRGNAIRVNEIPLTTFDYSTWFLRLRMAEDAFEELDEIISSKETREAHLERKYPVAGLAPAPEGLFRGVDLVRAGTESALDSAHNTYRRQMIVVAASHLEALIQAFFEKFFLRHPERMHDFIGSDENEARKGLIPLKKIIGNTKEELLLQLAISCGSKISKLSPTMLVKRLVQLTGREMPPVLAENMGSVINQRNRIVHENDQSTVPSDRVEYAFNCVVTLAQHCAYAAEQNGVKVRWEATE